MIIRCVDRLEAEHVLLGLIARGRRYDEQFDVPEAASVLVCECSPSCTSVYRTGSNSRGYTTDEIRDIIAAGGESSPIEDGGTPDLSFMPGTQTISEHEDGDVYMLQGELWDTGTGSVETLGAEEYDRNNGIRNSSITIEDLERFRDVMAESSWGSFIHGSDGRREDSSTSQGLRGGTPRVGTPEFYSWRHLGQAEGREQD